MSDTTITPEEKAEWRERLTSKFSCFDAELGGFTLRLLNALEVTEGMLDGSVQETRANFSAMYQACTEIIPDLKAKLADAEAENARLTKMVDWLAELVFDRPCAYACCPFDKHRPTGPDDDDCDKTHIQCWVEAASRAVAAGEAR